MTAPLMPDPQQSNNGHPSEKPQRQQRQHERKTWLIRPVSPLPALPLVQSTGRLPTPSRKVRKQGKLGKSSGQRLRAFSAHGIENLPTTVMPSRPSTPSHGNEHSDNNRPDVHHEHHMHNVQPVQPVRANTSQSGEQQRPGMRTPLPALHPNAVHRNRQEVEMAEMAEMAGRHVILHRASNFLVSTVNRTGQHIQPFRRRTGETTLMPKVVPQQKQRIVASETRMMPSVAPINPLKKSVFIVPNWVEISIVALFLLIGIIAHVYNMFNAPRYEPDEGTYMAAAFSLTQGKLWPYAFGYAHPPAGWIQVAALTQLTGGFFTFGNALNTGRAIMTIYAAGSSLLVYLIIRRLNGSRSAALLALVLFSLSPLSISYQRPFLLDTVATFWLLLSLYLIFVGNSRLHYIVFSAICFGLALLSKEVLLPFVPVMVYALWLHTTKFQRKFALIAFAYTTLAIASSYVLMALLKGELLPPGWLPWDQHPHLSLLDTYLSQVQRGQSQGKISDSISAWAELDLLLMIVSTVATVFNLVVGWWQRKNLLMALLAISFWTLLLRGGVIFPFYIIPLIPFIVMNVVMMVHTLTQWLAAHFRLQLVRVLIILAIIIAVVPYDVAQSTYIFNQSPTAASDQALEWVRDNIPHNSTVVINSFFYTDMRANGGNGVGNGAIYPYANIYWNVAFDPELRDNLLHGDWNNIDYIIADPAMLGDITNYGGAMKILSDAMQHSVLMKQFSAQDHDFQIIFRIYRVIHRNQSPASVYHAAPTRGTPASLEAREIASHISINRRVYTYADATIEYTYEEH